MNANTGIDPDVTRRRFNSASLLAAGHERPTDPTRLSRGATDIESEYLDMGNGAGDG